MTSDKLYRNEVWLRDQYINQEKSTSQIAKEVGLKSHTTIYNWITKFNIPPHPKGYPGVNNSNWKGGRRKSGEYWIIYKPDHPNKGNYVYEHVNVIEEEIKRHLISKEKVHHINMDKSDNRLENLDLLLDQSFHVGVHASLNKCVKKLLKMNVLKYNKEKHQYEVNSDGKR